jgi:hypothetical protein
MKELFRGRAVGPNLIVLDPILASSGSDSVVDYVQGVKR